MFLDREVLVRKINHEGDNQRIKNGAHSWFCLRGIQANSTAKLTIMVVKPMLQLVLPAIPWASTVQGLTPPLLVINNASPRPNKANPRHR